MELVLLPNLAVSGWTTSSSNWSAALTLTVLPARPIATPATAAATRAPEKANHEEEPSCSFSTMSMTGMYACDGATASIGYAAKGLT